VLSHRIDGGTVSALPATAPGATLDYTITLTNISAFDKPLEPGRAVSDLRRAVNAAGHREPNVPITFAMRLPIPADARSGAATLVWQLGDRGPAAKATVTIAHREGRPCKMTQSVGSYNLRSTVSSLDSQTNSVVRMTLPGVFA
jgi:hypothetical protein